MATLKPGIAQNVISWGAAEFARGMASSDYAADAPLGTSTLLVNPFVTPGIITPTATATTPTGTISGVLVASCEDGTNINGANSRLFVDTAAHFYLYTGSFASRQTGSKTYTNGITDMVYFASKAFASSTTDITMWDTTATGGGSHFDETYWTTTKSQSALISGSNNPHPLQVFNKLMWIGDANLLHNLSEAGTASNSVLTLSTAESIIALGIDPTTGLMLISTSNVPDYTGSSSSQAFVHLYDGFSAESRRKIPVDAPVTAFFTVGGQTFVTYGQNVGVWNGNGITFLRKLAHVSFTNTSLNYKHHLTNIANRVFIADGSRVLAFGEVVAGQKAWYNIASPPGGTTNLLCYVGNNKIAIGGTTGTCSVYDLSSTATGAGSLYASVVTFDRPVFVRRLRIITGGVTTSAGTGTAGFIDETFNTRYAAVNQFVVTAASSPYFIFDFNYGGQKAQTIQPFLTWTTQSFGIIAVQVWYDPTTD